MPQAASQQGQENMQRLRGLEQDWWLWECSMVHPHLSVQTYHSRHAGKHPPCAAARGTFELQHCLCQDAFAILPARAESACTCIQVVALFGEAVSFRYWSACESVPMCSALVNRSLALLIIMIRLREMSPSWPTLGLW